MGSPEENLVEEQIKSKDDELYIRILYVFGVLLLVMATVMTIMEDLQFTLQAVMLYVIGLFLFAAGVIWQERNKHHIRSLTKMVEEKQKKENQAYRFDQAR